MWHSRPRLWMPLLPQGFLRANGFHNWRRLCCITTRSRISESGAVAEWYNGLSGRCRIPGQGKRGVSLGLLERDRERRLATSREAAAGACGCALLCGALFAWALAVLLIVDGSPQVVWAVATVNALTVMATGFYRLQDRQKTLLAEMDMEPEHGPVRAGLQKHGKRLYMGLIMVHAVSALFLAAYYGIRWLRHAPLAAQGPAVGVVIAGLVVLSIRAWWRARTCAS